MAIEEKEPSLVSRRTFLKKTAAMGLGAAAISTLSACGASQATQSSQVKNWDKTADVVIIGAGGTGLVAAINASRAGAGKSVIILEKAAATGGSTSLSGAVIQAGGTKYEAQFKNVTDDSPDKHYQFYMQAAEGYVNPDLVKLLTDNAPAAVDWMVEQGEAIVGTYPVSYIPTVDEKYRLPRIHIPGKPGDNSSGGTIGNGKSHTDLMLKIAQSLGVEILLQTPATALITEDAKGVVGVKAQSNGKDITIKANKGVIIATSSFDHNKDMALAYSEQMLWEQETGMVVSAPTNTGDGIRMAMAIGADITGMGGTIGVPAVTIGTDGLSEGAQAVPGIWVNLQGQRFVDEASHYAYLIHSVFNQQSHLAWAVWDDKGRQLGGKLMGGALTGAWSDDLKAEISKGMVKTGNTPEELATAMGVNPKVLPVTIQKWNEDAKAGTDTVFGKTVFLSALETAPFYAAQITSMNLGSCGGLKINTQCQVLDVNGNVIPHLYAGGMAAGGFIGPYYPGSGTAILATVALGRISGENAAKETAV